MIHYFNPGHETAVFNCSPYYVPSENVLKMQNDLSFLPAWYGEKKDTVLVPYLKDPGYFKFMERTFSDLPGPVTVEDLPERDHEKILLWGISPASVHYFESINEKYNLSLQVPVWNEKLIYLNSRKAAAEVLSALQRSVPGIPETIIPDFCRNIEEIERMQNKANAPLLAKSLYSSSGRGLLWLSGGKLSPKEREVLNGMLKKQKEVAIEYVLDKQLDFSLQFLSDGRGGIFFQGYSLFKTTPKGAYSGTYIYPQEEIIRILSRKIPLSLLEHIHQELSLVLEKKYAPHYKGCIGVDMMIYKEAGEYRIHPCLEINMRYNMGFLGIKLHKRFFYGSSTGIFRIIFNSEQKGIYRQHQRMTRQNPLHIENGKIRSGYMALCPVTEASKYSAFILARDNM